MPRIRVNVDVLRQKAVELAECQDEQRQIISDVANLVEDILLDWEGEAQTGFVSAFENARPMYERFSGDVNTFVDFMNNYAGTMEYLDVGGRDEIQGGKSEHDKSVSAPLGHDISAVSHDDKLIIEEGSFPAPPPVEAIDNSKLALEQALNSIISLHSIIFGDDKVVPPIHDDDNDKVIPPIRPPKHGDRWPFRRDSGA